MMTPQEVASHAFAKATLGGYNMAMVDDFLDALTEDYTALYNDNAILKNKLKVLSDTVEEYRLKTAREATAAYVAKLRTLQAKQAAMLDELDQVVPPELKPEDDPAADIQASLSALNRTEPEPAPAEPSPAPQQEAEELDMDATRRFEDLQFGQDYEIE